MDTSKLPPKPDSYTGEPRPPRAPLESEGERPDDRKQLSADQVPRSPEGEGPLLEWFYPTRTGRLMAGVAMSAVLVVFGVLMDGGFSWMGVWWLWLIIAPWPLVFLASARAEKVYAGSDWLALDDDAYVKTYDLVTVKVHLDGAAHAVEMVDNNGRNLRPKVIRLQRNHRLWDLVYNGILHSVHVGGAETNKRARDYLLLDNPPTVRQQ